MSEGKDFSVLISVITVNLDNREGLRKTIESVVGQSRTDFEWIVVDGGSTDGSRELAERWSERIDCLVSEPDSGIFNAMNKGIRLSHGEYLLFLNSGDTLFDEHVLERAAEHLDGKEFYVGSTMTDDGLRTTDVSSEEQLAGDFIFGGGFPHQGTFIARRTFDEYGFYDEQTALSADAWHFYKAIFLGHARVGGLPFTVAVFASGGVSFGQTQRIKEEQARLLARYPMHRYLNNFYRDNYEKIAALNDSRPMYFVFRVCYWFYRKTKRKR